MGVYFLEKYNELSKSTGYLLTRMDHMNMNFEYFQIQKWMLKLLERKKKMKKGSHLFNFHVLFLIYGPEIVLKTQFFAI